MMKHNILFLLIFVFSFQVSGQSLRKIVRDFDGDAKKDTVRIDSDSKSLICRLSTQNYKLIQSGVIQRLNFGNTLVATKEGFEFWNDFDRSGFQCVFRFNQKEKKFQLVKMRRIDDILSFDYGDEAKGKSSINLVTNEYIGDFYQLYQGKLKKMPTIRAKMVFPATYLQTFNDIICFEYEKKCLTLYKTKQL